MNELLKLLAQFLQCLQQQMTLMEDLLGVLAREEELVVSFSLPEFEKLVTEKDQIVRLIQAAEDRRLQVLKKLCFMMAFDARGKMPTLTEFIAVARSYLENIERLVDAETHQRVRASLGDIESIAVIYRSAFLHAQPRIEQNKLILSALARNFKRSVMVFQNEAALTKRYNEKGRSVAPNVQKDGITFVRVRA
ncbi:hypothetical protein EBU99_11780 [bacterium]|nr:hypothetical protein [bacterium]